MPEVIPLCVNHMVNLLNLHFICFCNLAEILLIRDFFIVLDWVCGLFFLCLPRESALINLFYVHNSIIISDSVCS